MEEMSLDYFPEEIIQEILLKLPIKYLLRCTTVCKSWLSLIKSSSFIGTHLRNQNDLPNLPPLFVSCGECGSCFQHFSLLCDNEGLRFPEHISSRAFDKHDLIHPTEVNNFVCGKGTVRWFDVVGTCNGLVCLTGINFGENDWEDIIAIIWNPSIRRFVILPNPSVSFKKGFGFASYAFGYDPSTNDYKLLRSVVHDSNQIPCEVEVWSLARGSWKSLSPDIIPANFRPREPDYLHGRGRHDYGKHVFVSGALHWVQPCNINRHKSIVLFSMSSDSFGEIALPEVLKKDSHDCYMSRYSESLALLFEDFDSYNCAHLWVMKEYGVAESWTKLITVEGVHSGVFVKPYCFRKNGELLFKVLPDGGWGWIGLNFKLHKHINNHDCDYNFMDSCIESIVLLDLPNFISY